MNFWKQTLFLDLKHLNIRFFLLVQVKWKKVLVPSKKCTTQTTRTVDFATPDYNLSSLGLRASRKMFIPLLSIINN